MIFFTFRTRAPQKFTIFQKRFFKKFTNSFWKKYHPKWQKYAEVNLIYCVFVGFCLRSPVFCLFFRNFILKKLLTFQNSKYNLPVLAYGWVSYSYKNMDLFCACCTILRPFFLHPGILHKFFIFLFFYQKNRPFSCFDYIFLHYWIKKPGARGILSLPRKADRRRQVSRTHPMFD